MQNPRWFDYPENSEDAARLATELAKRLWQQQSPARTLARRHLERYHGASLLPANWQYAFQLQEDLPLVWNLTRSFVSTVVARVGASSSPKVQFVTSDANWSTRRKAQKLDQFVDALALQAAPPFQSIHELRTALLRDACLFGRGIAQVSADPEAGRVVTERVLPWEYLFDGRDARYNCPSEVARAYPIARHTLQAWFPDRAEDIDAAKDASILDLESELGLVSVPTRVIRDQVQIYEVWVVAAGPDAPGRHIMILDGSLEPLVDEEYTLESPPFAIIYWDHPLIGGWNQSLADETAPLEDEINRSLLRLSDSARRTALNVVYYSGDSVDPKVIEDTADAVAIQYQGQTPPLLQQAQAINPSMVEWLQLLASKAHDITGISEMAATGAREPGLSSGAAVRAVSAQQSQRFAWLWRQIENWQIQWAKLAIAAVRHIADQDESYLVRWPGAGFLKSIKWKEVDLDEDQFIVQIYAVGQEKNTPADRLQRAEELYQSGVISLQSYEAIVNGSQDTKAETRQQSIQRELINSYIEHWLDATDEQMASGMWDEEKQIKLIPPPIKWLQLNDAVLQVALAYLEAELNGAPDANRQLFLDWLEMADAELQQQQQRQMALQQVSKGVSAQNLIGAGPTPVAA